MKNVLSLKLEDEERLAWNEKAKAVGLTLSAWIRKKCNEEPAPKESDEVAAVQSVRAVRDPAVLERGSVSAGGVGMFDEPAYKSHSRSCGCGPCNFARGAGLK